VSPRGLPGPLTKLSDAAAGCNLAPKDREYLSDQTNRWCGFAKKGIDRRDRMTPE
jgi:hypothetical protein